MVMGIDLNAAYQMAAARGYDLTGISILLQEAEAALVQTLNQKSSDELDV